MKGLIERGEVGNRLDVLLFAGFELLDEFGERGEFFGVDEFVLVDEKDEVLEAGVEMVFEPQTHHVVEVAVVNMRIYSEQSFEYHFDDVEEVLRKRGVEPRRKDCVVVELMFDPGHQEIDVLCR